MGCPGVVYVDSGVDELDDDGAELEEALDVMPAIDMETLNDMDLIDSLGAATELRLVWDVDWFAYDDAEELLVQEPYIV